MKLSIISDTKSTLAIAEASAKIFTHIIYTINEDYDFFGHMLNKVTHGGRKYASKPKRKGRKDFKSGPEGDSEYEKYLEQYEKDMETYHKTKSASKASRSSSGSPSPSPGNVDATNPYAQAASGMLGAGIAALKSKIAPSISTSSDAVIRLFTNGRQTTSSVKQLIGAAANHNTDILNDNVWLTSFFNDFLPGLRLSDSQEVLANTRKGSTPTESSISTACFIMDNYDPVIVSNALQNTSSILSKTGLNISEAGIRQAFDAARRFIAQPRAVAASSQQSKLRSANISNAKLLVQNILMVFDRKLKAAGVNSQQIPLLTATQLQQLKQRLGL